MKLLNLSIFILIFAVSSQAYAKGGGFSFGAMLGITTTDQTDMNTLIKDANADLGSSVSELGNAWEIGGYIQYRVGDWGLQFRPSYFTQSEDGDGNDYSITGINIFPVARWYLLESNTVKFFTNFSIGFGLLNGEIKEGTSTVEFSGNSLGYMIGLGAEFCFFGGDHCMQLEGNLRRLNMERTVVEGGNGARATGSTQLTQAGEGQELEINDRDFEGDMSGMNASIGYVLYF